MNSEVEHIETEKEVNDKRYQNDEAEDICGYNVLEIVYFDWINRHLNFKV